MDAHGRICTYYLSADTFTLKPHLGQTLVPRSQSKSPTTRLASRAHQPPSPYLLLTAWICARLAAIELGCLTPEWECRLWSRGTHTHTHTHTYAEKETNTQTVIGVANSGQALPRRGRRRERKLHHGKSEILVVVSNDDPK